MEWNMDELTRPKKRAHIAAIQEWIRQEYWDARNTKCPQVAHEVAHHLYCVASFATHCLWELPKSILRPVAERELEWPVIATPFRCNATALAIKTIGLGQSLPVAHARSRKVDSPYVRAALDIMKRWDEASRQAGAFMKYMYPKMKKERSRVLREDYVRRWKKIASLPPLTKQTVGEWDKLLFREGMDQAFYEYRNHPELNALAKHPRFAKEYNLKNYFCHLVRQAVYQRLP